MAPSERFKPVHRLAQSKERHAAQRLGDCQQSVRQAEAKLEELSRYRQEYHERFSAAGRAGMSAVKLQEYQAFLARLNEAIEHQEALLKDSRQDRKSKRDQWLHRHTRTQALGKVVERCVKDEQKIKQRREQKETDEYGQRPRFVSFEAE